jgi:cytosine/adenosine deaminase-related metal-dependent hydrolase
LSLLIRNGLVVTMNDRFEIVEGDVSIQGGRIAAIGANLSGHHSKTIDARGGFILPGSSRRIFICARRSFAATPMTAR